MSVKNYSHSTAGISQPFADLRTSLDPAYPIEDLFKILKNSEQRGKKETGYLLGLGGRIIIISPSVFKGPIIFLISVTEWHFENKKDFLLFLGKLFERKLPSAYIIPPFRIRLKS